MPDWRCFLVPGLIVWSEKVPLHGLAGIAEFETNLTLIGIRLA